VGYNFTFPTNSGEKPYVITKKNTVAPNKMMGAAVELGSKVTGTWSLYSDTVMVETLSQIWDVTRWHYYRQRTYTKTTRLLDALGATILENILITTTFEVNDLETSNAWTIISGIAAGEEIVLKGSLGDSTNFVLCYSVSTIYYYYNTTVTPGVFGFPYPTDSGQTVLQTSFLCINSLIPLVTKILTYIIAEVWSIDTLPIQTIQTEITIDGDCIYPNDTTWANIYNLTVKQFLIHSGCVINRSRPYSHTITSATGLFPWADVDLYTTYVASGLIFFGRIYDVANSVLKCLETWEGNTITGGPDLYFAELGLGAPACVSGQLWGTEKKGKIGYIVLTGVD
jgi:hypothetical protein